MQKHRKPATRCQGEQQDENNSNAVLDVFLQNKPMIRRYVNRIVKNTADADDLIQETFLRVHEAAKKTTIKSISAFMYKTARNLALQHQQRKSAGNADYSGDFPFSEIIDNSPGVEDQVAAQSDYIRFCKAVETLPEKIQQVITLRLFLEMPYKDIAKKLDISLSSVEKYMALGILVIRDYMKAPQSRVAVQRVTEEQKIEKLSLE